MNTADQGGVPGRSVGTDTTIGPQHARPDGQVSWIQYHARRTPQRTAFVETDSGRTLTYGEFDERIHGAARALAARGVRAGDRVAVLAYGSAHVFEVMYACALLRCVMVPLNWRLRPAELAAILADCRPTALLHDDTHADTAQQIAGPAGVDFTLSWSTSGSGEAGDSYERALIEDAAPVPPGGLTHNTPWIIIYTSGTTGMPKGVVHTVGSVRANIDNSALSGEVSARSVCLNFLPTFHVAGLHLFPNAVLFHGGTVHLMQRFDAEATLRLLWDPELGITHFNGVPANYQLMARTETFLRGTPRPFVGSVGGSPVPAAMAEQWRATGAAIMQVYGITEAGSTVLTMPPDVTPTDATAVGLPALTVECDVRDTDGNSLPAGRTGELWLSGPSVMVGYWQRPEATADALQDDGWLRTGDAARIGVDGMVHIVDRWKDMYISGGENVYPAEVENVVYQHPGVVLATVIGVPDEKWGEVGHAFVVTAADASPDEEEIRQWCRERMAPYKVPARITFVADLPRNATGKILKNVLRDQLSSNDVPTA